MSRKPIKVTLQGCTGVRWLAEDGSYKVNVGFAIVEPSKALEDRIVQVDLSPEDARGLANQLLDLANKADRYNLGDYQAESVPKFKPKISREGTESC